MCVNYIRMIVLSIWLTWRSIYRYIDCRTLHHVCCRSSWILVCPSQQGRLVSRHLCECVCVCVCVYQCMHFHYPYKGAVYLKNTIFKYWKERDQTEVVGNELPYCIPEPSKTLIRENIIGAIIQSPTLIR